MRINKYVAQATGLSRRAVDAAVEQGRVTVNDTPALLGQEVISKDIVKLDDKILKLAATTTIMLHKPVGYVCSRTGQGSKTIYDLLPAAYRQLKPVGRLDKDSSGLLLLTNDGQLANQLTHPSFQKEKIYEVRINRPLAQQDLEKITKTGVNIGEKSMSRFQLQAIRNKKQEKGESLVSDSPYSVSRFFYSSSWLATLTEGKNRQIRRTFGALGYKVIGLHRTQFGNYRLPADLKAGYFKPL